MKTVVAPFLQPSPSSINHGGWHLLTPAGETPLPDEVPHWDYQTVLSLRAAVSVARDQILQDCQLGAESDLAVVVLAKSDRTGAHGPVIRLPVPRQETYDLALEFDLPGHTLGGRLELQTHLIASACHPLNQLAPYRSGSILWRARHRAYLEGTAARFPTDTADFRLTRPKQARAAWFFHLDTSDPEAAFMSAARITLNTGSDVVRRMLAGDTNSDAFLLLRTMRWDVTRQLVFAALRSTDVSDGPADHESTTVAATLRSLLAQVWPYDEPSQLRQRLELHPELIELQIQNHARLAD